MTKHNSGLGEVFLDELDGSPFDRRRFLCIPCCRRRTFFQLSKWVCTSAVACSSVTSPTMVENDLGRGVFLPIEGLHVGQGDLAERLLRSIHGPAVGVPVEDELIERLHGDMAWVVVVACHLAQELGANPFEFLLMKCGVLQHVCKQSKAEVDVFLQNAGGGGGEIF